MKRVALVLAALAGAVAAPAATTSATAVPARPLETGVADPETFGGSAAAVALSRARQAGATIVRLSLDWRAVAPNATGARPPRRFDPTDPADPAYRFEGFDEQVTLARQRGLDPIVTVTNAPVWARRRVGRGGATRADPVAFARFALAAARRYGGGFRDLPRVRYWQPWNEPNHVGRVVLKEGAAEWYRALVNRFAAAVHRIHRDNVVVAGGTSPFTTTTSVGPLLFMRRLLCMGGGAKKPPTCRNQVHFDVWAHNPYTSGGPTHEARGGDDVSLGDLPEMRRLLTAAARAGRIVSTRRLRFWVTEFSWDTSPPDPKAVPIRLQTRWVAEALYRMWSAGVSLVVWWRIRDDPLATSFYQSGLFRRGTTIAGDRPKSTFYAFRFPFVAFPESGGRVFVWGRTPWGEPGTVLVEQAAGGAWRRLGTSRTNGHGIFSTRYQTSLGGPLRARLADGSASYPFSLKSEPDRFYRPFGS